MTAPVLTVSFCCRFAEAGDDDEDSDGDETVERVIERLREVNHSYLEKSKLVKMFFTFFMFGFFVDGSEVGLI